LYFTFFEESKKKKTFAFFSVALKEKTKGSIRRQAKRANASGATRSGGKEGHLPPGAAFLGRQIEVGMFRDN